MCKVSSNIYNIASNIDHINYFHSFLGKNVRLLGHTTKVYDSMWWWSCMVVCVDMNVRDIWENVQVYHLYGTYMVISLLAIHTHLNVHKICKHFYIFSIGMHFQIITSAVWGFGLCSGPGWTWHGRSPVVGIQLVTMSHCDFPGDRVDQETHTMQNIFIWYII